MQKTSIGPLEWALLIGLSIIWGGSYLFMKIAVASVPVFTIVFARVALGALALALVILIMRTEFPKSVGVWRAFLGMGIINNVIPMSLIVYGTSKIDAGLASIINAMTPLFAIIIAHFATTDERFTANRLFGVVLGVCGVIVLIGPSFLFNSDVNIWGELACLAATLSYASASIFGRRFARMKFQPIQIAFGQTASASLVLLPISFVIDKPWTIGVPTEGAILSIAALGILCTAIGYLMYFRVLNNSGAVAVALVTLLIPPSALVLGIFVLGEILSLTDLLGMGLIGVGLVIVNIKMKSAHLISERNNATTSS
jgi:drug/metabolite transporter (DMT)-like permease